MTVCKTKLNVVNIQHGQVALQEIGESPAVNMVILFPPAPFDGIAIGQSVTLTLESEDTAPGFAFASNER
jgi:hypothetical protein